MESFPALLLEEAEGNVRANVKRLSLSDLPDYDVLVEISYSSLNYKDGLALTGKSRIARKLPMVAGIDLAGTVVRSRSPDWQAGDKVVVNGWGLSETEWGGYTRFQRLKPEWLTRLPDAFTLEQAMAVGTAGYTAALCVNALEDWGAISRDRAEVLVTGAAGGVGSVAVSLLSAKGYRVVAATGRPQMHDYLRSLGAVDCIDRAELSGSVRPLQKERWSGAVDSVGSVTLAHVLAQTVYGGAVAACGIAGGTDLPASMFAHILRSVTLIGIDSVYASPAKRRRAWQTLADHLNSDRLAAMSEVHPLHDLPELAARIVAGDVRGRVAIRISEAGEGR